MKRKTPNNSFKLILKLPNSLALIETASCHCEARSNPTTRATNEIASLPRNDDSKTPNDDDGETLFC